jgi:hypothetical protein
MNSVRRPRSHWWILGVAACLSVAAVTASGAVASPPPVESEVSPQRLAAVSYADQEGTGWVLLLSGRDGAGCTDVLALDSLGNHLSSVGACGMGGLVFDGRELVSSSGNPELATSVGEISVNNGKKLMHYRILFGGVTCDCQVNATLTNGETFRTKARRGGFVLTWSWREAFIASVEAIDLSGRVVMGSTAPDERVRGQPSP